VPGSGSPASGCGPRRCRGSSCARTRSAPIGSPTSTSSTWTRARCAAIQGCDPKTRSTWTRACASASSPPDRFDSSPSRRPASTTTSTTPSRGRT
jgi:hypothetical protein